MKTLVIRKGDRLTIRAIAVSVEGQIRDKCEILAFFQDCAKKWPKEFYKLSGLLSDAADYGPPPDTKKFKPLMGSDLYEFKTHFGLRLICFWDDKGLIICTQGYVKDGQKAPKSELTKADKIRKDYFRAKEAGQLNHAQPRNQSPGSV